MITVQRIVPGSREEERPGPSLPGAMSQKQQSLSEYTVNSNRSPNTATGSQRGLYYNQGKQEVLLRG